VVTARDESVGQAAVEDHAASLAARRRVAGMATNREQPWSDDAPEHGQVVEQTPVQWLAANPLREADAFVLCDHDTPGMEELLRAALDGKAGYVAMMGSRRRAERVFDALEAELPPETLARLHVPAGLNTGGKAPGELALSVV